MKSFEMTGMANSTSHREPVGRGTLGYVRDTRDYFAIVIITFLVAAAGWLLLLPCSSTVQKIAVRRFHLATERFSVWAIQQTIPSMYNFENRTWVSKDRISHIPGETPKEDRSIVAETINHFPTRVFTFADLRLRHLQSNERCFFFIQTTYQQTVLQTEWVAMKEVDGSYTVSRLPPKE